MTKSKYFGLTKTAWENLCTRCGKCCMLTKNIPCQYQIFSSDGKAACTIYKTRLNANLGHDRVCAELKDVYYLPLDCPYRKFFPSKPTEPE